jgi:hypothetical protein
VLEDELQPAEWATNVVDEIAAIRAATGLA